MNAWYTGIEVEAVRAVSGARTVTVQPHVAALRTTKTTLVSGRYNGSQ